MSTVRGMDNEREIAEKLGVRLLLAGSVLQANDRVVLSVRLTDPRSGRVIWGSQLERLPSNILSARFEIANLVAARLSLAVPNSGAADSRQLKAEAQDAFLRGLVELQSGANARYLAAVQLFGRAVELESGWADALANLAFAQQLVIETGDPAERQRRAEIVKSNAMRAIQIDPGLPMSYTALAAVQAYHDWDFNAAEQTLRQGIEASPRDAVAHGRLALLLAATGRLPEALAEAEQARDLEPLLPERYTTLGITRYYARDFERALQDMQRALEIRPNFGPALFGSGRVLSAAGRHDEAIRSIRAALELSPDDRNPAWWAGLAIALSRSAQDAAQLEDVLVRLRRMQTAGVFVSIDNFAYIAANQGRLDDAFSLLEQALNRRMTNVLWLAVDPWADPLRSDPRFDNVIERMGLLKK
jgi:tetratricopeptide (TPR) repeat protein